MNPDELVVQEVQKAATVQDLVNDHINGLGGYEIAAKYGMDTERVKDILREANNRGAFVPAGTEMPVDHVEEAAIVPLDEGEAPLAGSPKGHK